MRWICMHAANAVSSYLTHRLLKVEKAFDNVSAISILPIPRYSELQLLAINNSVQLKMFTGYHVAEHVCLHVSNRKA